MHFLLVLQKNKLFVIEGSGAGKKNPHFLRFSLCSLRLKPLLFRFSHPENIALHRWLGGTLFCITDANEQKNSSRRLTCVFRRTLNIWILDRRLAVNSCSNLRLTASWASGTSQKKMCNSSPIFECFILVTWPVPVHLSCLTLKFGQRYNVQMLRFRNVTFYGLRQILGQGRFRTGLD